MGRWTRTNIFGGQRNRTEGKNEMVAKFFTRLTECPVGCSVGRFESS